eukprot:gene429-2431_t
MPPKGKGKVGGKPGGKKGPDLAKIKAQVAAQQAAEEEARRKEEEEIRLAQEKRYATSMAVTSLCAPCLYFYPSSQKEAEEKKLKEEEKAKAAAAAAVCPWTTHAIGLAVSASSPGFQLCGWLSRASRNSRLTPAAIPTRARSLADRDALRKSGKLLSKKQQAKAAKWAGMVPDPAATATGSSETGALCQGPTQGAVSKDGKEHKAALHFDKKKKKKKTQEEPDPVPDQVPLSEPTPQPECTSPNPEDSAPLQEVPAEEDPGESWEDMVDGSAEDDNADNDTDLESPQTALADPDSAKSLAVPEQTEAPSPAPAVQKRTFWCLEDSECSPQKKTAKNMG